MLSRRYLAAAVLAAGLALTAAVPAVAATTSATTTPSATSAPSVSPTTTASQAAAAKASAAAAAAAAAKQRALGLPCAVVTANGKRILEVKPISGKETVAQLKECKLLAARQIGVPFPKGAPETGGGGMAAEVSTWN